MYSKPLISSYSPLRRPSAKHMNPDVIISSASSNSISQNQYITMVNIWQVYLINIRCSHTDQHTNTITDSLKARVSRQETYLFMMQAAYPFHILFLCFIAPNIEYVMKPGNMMINDIPSTNKKHSRTITAMPKYPLLIQCAGPPRGPSSRQTSRESRRQRRSAPH